MSIIIHFGMNKTGSASIQQSLYHHLSDERFHYLRIEGANHGESLRVAFVDNPANLLKCRVLGLSSEQIHEKRNELKERLAQELIFSINKPPLISAEAIFSMNMPSIDRI